MILWLSNKCQYFHHSYSFIMKFISSGYSKVYLKAIRGISLEKILLKSVNIVGKPMGNQFDTKSCSILTSLRLATFITCIYIYKFRCFLNINGLIGTVICLSCVYYAALKQEERIKINPDTQSVSKLKCI